MLFVRLFLPESQMGFDAIADMLGGIMMGMLLGIISAIVFIVVLPLRKQWLAVGAYVVASIVAWFGMVLTAPEYEDPPVSSAQESTQYASSKDIQHYIFFGIDRDRIAESTFLDNPGIAGAQLKYTWKMLEPEKGVYNLEPISKDLAFLQKNGKRLFIQLQDVSFEEALINVPDYLTQNEQYNGGVARQFTIENDDETTAKGEGWVSRRWDPEVQDRYIALLNVLGEAFDGKIEGINLPETAVEFGASGNLHPEGFTFESYFESIKVLMRAASEAFPQSRVIQYANFMPGEWLPGGDQGYLRGIYRYAEEVGIGVGGPDILPYRRWQQMHSLPLIAERNESVIAGMAVQWGNLEDIDPGTGIRVTVETLHRYAEEELQLDYIFWGTQQPFYSQEILPYLRQQ